MLWRYAKKSVALRIRYLITSPKGADSNTVLVQDIPGIGFGTQAERAKSVAPKFVANKVLLSYPARLPNRHACRTCVSTQAKTFQTCASTQIEMGIEKSTAAALKAADTASQKATTMTGYTTSQTLCMVVSTITCNPCT